MTTERKLLPLPFSLYLVSEWAGPDMVNRNFWTAWRGEQVEAYARANMAPLEAEIARLREALEAYERISLIVAAQVTALREGE